VPQERLSAKKAVGWFVAVLGMLIGFLSIVGLSQSALPRVSSDEYWAKEWAGFIGLVPFGFIFLIASITAIRKPRSAGLVFLIGGPLVAFWGAFAGAGYLEWHADGGGYFESPFLSTALGLACLFFIPFALALSSVRNKLRSVVLFVVSAAVVTPFIARSPWTASFIPELAGWTAVFLAFGLFWLLTHKHGWPPLLQSRERALSSRIRAVLATCLAVLLLDIALSLVFAALRSSLFSADCGPEQPFTHSLSPNHVVFTARVIYVGRSLEARFRVPSPLADYPDRRLGDWAVGIVETRYWGLLWWRPRLVLLTDDIYWKGETYFVDGHRPDGMLTRLLPIVSGGIICSRTRPLRDAIVDLRELKGGAPANGTRIIGYVRAPQPYAHYFQPPTVPVFVSGAKVAITSQKRESVVTTDESGLYEIDGLPPDNYKLKLLLPETQHAEEQEITAQSFSRSSTLERDFQVVWNGTIEGIVTGAPKDSKRGP